MNEGIDLSRQGRFDESNTIFLHLLNELNLSEDQTSIVYSELIANALHVGDYKSVYKFLVAKNGENSGGEQAVWKAIASMPEQSIDRPDINDTVRFIVDSLYLNGQLKGSYIRIPVSIGGKDEMMILDNGCPDACVVTESFALEHDIRIFGTDTPVAGISKKTTGKFGMADSLSIGGLLFRHILFLIMPDSNMGKGMGKIDAMIGSNVMRLAGEMDFDMLSKTIVFPINQQDKEPNIILDKRGHHFIEAQIGKSDAVYMLQFDLGCSDTELFPKYYESHQKETSSGKRVYSWNGGVGGVKKVKQYEIPISISVCGGIFSKSNLRVRTTKLISDDEYGRLGNDFILSFGQVVLNLDRMFMYIKW